MKTCIWRMQYPVLWSSLGTLISLQCSSLGKYFYFQLKKLHGKHEEEVQILLEDKLRLSKKLEMINDWGPW